MRRWLSRAIKAALALAVVAFALLLAWAFLSRQMPALQPWHTTQLEAEFTRADSDRVTDLAGYLAQEERLFAELDQKIYQRGSADGTAFSRYLAGGPQDPAWPQRNWNRSFELVPEHIRGGALLLHGLTDSPYSLREVAQTLYREGYYVLGLRLPGHGTIPAALTTVYWEDWVAASRLGARHVQKRIGRKQPMLIAGYSNGGGLAVKYALDALEDESLPAPDQLVLFSPEISISRAGAIANSHKLLSFLPYFAQFKWLDLLPEYDPFKYNSFPKNAAQQAWEVTASIALQIERSAGKGKIAEFPPTLGFLSWSDATVHTAATIERLYDHLEDNGSELVIFGTNRLHFLSEFVPPIQTALAERLKVSHDLPYRLTVISNLSTDTQRMAVLSKAAHASTIQEQALGLVWPAGIFSLSHVAIPFPADDPVYGAGADPSGNYRGLPLGALQARGETNLLTVPLGKLMRLRHNPFFSYIDQRITELAEDLTK